MSEPEGTVVELLPSDLVKVLEAFVKKIPYAYPVYDLEYKKNLTPVMNYVGALTNIHTTGRQGNFRYNNMDQSIEMGRRMAWIVQSRRVHLTGVKQRV